MKFRDLLKLQFPLLLNKLLLDLTMTETLTSISFFTEMFIDCLMVVLLSNSLSAVVG